MSLCCHHTHTCVWDLQRLDIRSACCSPGWHRPEAVQILRTNCQDCVCVSMCGCVCPYEIPLSTGPSRSPIYSWPQSCCNAPLLPTLMSERRLAQSTRPWQVEKLPKTRQHFENSSNAEAVAMSVWRISNTCCGQPVDWQQDPWVSAFLIPISLQQHSQTMNPKGM